jgi:hypothetical protein
MKKIIMNLSIFGALVISSTSFASNINVIDQLEGQKFKVIKEHSFNPKALLVLSTPKKKKLKLSASWERFISNSNKSNENTHPCFLKTTDNLSKHFKEIKLYFGRELLVDKVYVKENIDDDFYDILIKFDDTSYDSITCQKFSEKEIYNSKALVKALKFNLELSTLH